MLKGGIDLFGGEGKFLELVDGVRLLVAQQIKDLLTHGVQRFIIQMVVAMA